MYATFTHYFPHFFTNAVQFSKFKDDAVVHLLLCITDLLAAADASSQTSLLPEMLPMCRRLPKTPIGNFKTAVRLVSESDSKLSACYPVIL